MSSSKSSAAAAAAAAATARKTPKHSTDFYSKFYFDRDYFNIGRENGDLGTSRADEPERPPCKKKRKSGQNRAQQGHPEQLSQSSPDPSLEGLAHGTTLIIGRSGTGKSSLLKTLVSRIDNSSVAIYLINVRPDETSEYKKLTKCPIESTTLEGAKKVRPRSIIIVEDIISLKNREQTSLRETLNYIAHHKKCKVYCVTHGIYKTGLFTAMTFFNFLVFTNSPANAPIVKQALERFALSKQEVGQCVNNLMHFASASNSESLEALRKIYFFWDCTRMRFGMSEDTLLPGSLYYIDGRAAAASSSSKTLKNELSTKASNSDGTAGDDAADGKKRAWNRSSKEREKTKRFFERFFARPCDRRRASAIFELLMSSSIARRALDPATLTLRFRRGLGKSARKEGPVQISLVDYVHTLLTADARITAKDRTAHSFVTSVCQLPLSCIVNRSWKQALNPEEL
jgi:energy-coupling factor transporter ATP-binding protein EcfA2